MTSLLEAIGILTIIYFVAPIVIVAVGLAIIAYERPKKSGSCASAGRQSAQERG